MLYISPENGVVRFSSLVRVCRLSPIHTLGSIATYSVKLTEYKNGLSFYWTLVVQETFLFHSEFQYTLQTIFSDIPQS